MAPLLLLVLFGGLCALLSFASSSRTKPTTKDHGHVKKSHEDDCRQREEEKKKASSDIIDLSMVFSTFDHDGDGFITTSELEESFKRLGIVASRTEAISMVEKVDANHDGLIDIDEFRELYNSIPVVGGEDDKKVESGNGEDEEKDLKEAFDVFDGNGDGLISAEELDTVLGSLGLRHGRKAADCRDMIRRVDSDGDGMVNFEEFKRMMVVKG